MTRDASTRQAFRIAFQIVGLVVAILLLVWSASQAFSEDNRAQIEQLRDAPVHQSLLLLALSFGTILVNGVLFYWSIRSVRRIDMVGVQATNAVAWLLSYLPFKISALMRVIVHNRRDGIPVLMVGSWFLVIGLLAGTTVLPLVLASLLRDEIDMPWITVASILLVALAVLVVVVAGWLETDDRITRLPIASRIHHLDAFANVRAGLRMLDARTVAGTTVLRVIDIAILAAKFRLASMMVGVEIGLSQCVLFAVVFFTIGMITPFGMLGIRVGATSLFAGFTLDEGQQHLITLLVDATEAIASFAAAAVGIVILRPDRLLRRARSDRRDQDDEGLEGR